MSEIGRMSVTVTADTRQMVDKIQRDGDAAGRSFGQKFAGGLGTLGKGMLAVGGIAAAAGVAAGAFGVKVAAENEKAAATFTTLMGSAEAAQKQMKVLADFAAKTPFELPQVREAAARLQAVGVSADSVVPLLTRIGDATSAMGTGADGIQRSVAALQKMQITGKVTAESMNMLAEAGVPAWQALAEASGKSVAEVQQAVTDGMVKATDVQKALLDKTNGAFSKLDGMMEKQSQTLAGLFSTLKDNVSQALGEAAQPLADGLKNALPAITEAVTGLVNNLKPAIAQVGPLIGTLATVLAPVADVLGKIGGAILGALTSALQTLIPALTPVLAVLSSLADRVGPLIGAVLGKLAEVLAKLLQAVVPLLQPLVDLVFTILDAAWPIIEVVVDAVMLLVDALAPLLQAVGALLKPIGDLIKTGLGALMPVIKPLLPVIQALATVIGDVLGRAIGLIITAFGYWIQAAAKVAPFLLRQLVQPVVQGFLTMAENVVGAAAEAFSWVPGLGDKLDTAKKAVSDFKKNAETGIAQAATTIEREGERIGKGLVDQGIAAMKDPAAAARLTGSARNLGLNASEALAAGIRSGQVPVQAASAQVANAATASAKAALQVHSPSRVFLEIGGNVVDGFALGLKPIGKVSQEMLDKLNVVIDASQKKIDKWVETVRTKLDDAVQAWKDYRTESMNAIMGGVNVGDAWTKAGDSQRAAEEAFQRLEKAKADLAKAGSNATDSDRGAVTDAQAEYDRAKAAIVSFETAFQQQLTESNLYGTAMQKVSEAITQQFGPNSVGGQMLIQQLQAMGPGAGTQLANYLITQGLLPQTVTDLTNANVFAGEVGTKMADDAKLQGVTMAQKQVAGLQKQIKAERDRIVAQGEKIGDGMIVGLGNKEGEFQKAISRFISQAMSSISSLRAPGGGGVQAAAPDASGLLGAALDSAAGSGPGPTRMYAPSLLGIEAVQVEAPDVRVFIGDRELTDIVRTEVVDSNAGMARSLVLGRR